MDVGLKTAPDYHREDSFIEKIYFKTQWTQQMSSTLVNIQE